MLVRIYHLITAAVITLFIVVSLSVCLIVIYPFSKKSLRRVRAWFTWIWAKMLCRGLGIKIRVMGKESGGVKGNVYLVSNHLSYLDIIVLATVRPMTFVSKHDVAAWPVIGWMTKLGGTIFVNREAKSTSYGLVETLADALAQGAPLLVFPEGTSTDGQDVLPFKTSLFEAPVRTNTTVQPMTLRYLSVGGKPLEPRLRDLLCWYGDMDFAPHAWKMLTLRGIEVEVTLGRPLEPGTARKSLAGRAREGVLENFRPLCS